MLSETFRNFYFQVLRDLVCIPSRSTPRGGEEARVQRYVASRFEEAGVRTRCFEAADVPEFFTHPLCSKPSREYSGRPTVLGEVGPAAAPALLVLAHSDTVPVFAPEKWTRDPFDPGSESDKIFGLGVGDDKWGVAALCIMAKVLARRGDDLSKRVIFASTIDEESGVGNGLLQLHLAGVRAEAALYLDGCDAQILLGNLGGATITLQPCGYLADAHFAADAQALTAACRNKSARRAALFDRPYLRDNPMRHSSVGLRLLHHEGTPKMQIPFYTVEGEDPATIRCEMEELLNATLGSHRERYAISWSTPWFEPAFTDLETPLVSHLAQAFQSVTGREPEYSCNTKQDTFVLINHAGIPTISFGAARSQMPGAYHCPDEFVEANFVWDCVQTAHEAVARWLESEEATP